MSSLKSKPHLFWKPIIPAGRNGLFYLAVSQTSTRICLTNNMYWKIIVEATNGQPIAQLKIMCTSFLLYSINYKICKRDGSLSNLEVCSEILVSRWKKVSQLLLSIFSATTQRIFFKKKVFWELHRCATPLYHFFNSSRILPFSPKFTILSLITIATY